ncbi:MAG: RNA polymerase sigma factor [Acidobacteriaceae bacterium]|nr:RNA polymerase sigma factor [Acidobacteriaceae bacterium]
MMIAEYAADPDAALMMRVREGDAPSFEILLHRHRSAVVNHLFRMVHNRAIAEELAQDVFVRVYRSRERYEPSAKFTTWLFRITTNVALNWRRDTRRQTAELHVDQLSTCIRAFEFRDEKLQMDEVMIRQNKAKEVRSAVELLPSKQLAAVLMHKYEGMDYAQIAEVLNCSVPALKSLLFRAYENLRRQLAHLDPFTSQVR